MNLSDMLPAGGIGALANQLGIPRDQAEQGAQALLPSILGGLGDKAGGPEVGDAVALESHLQELGGAGLADNVIGSEPTDIDRGNQLLGGIFGSKDVSREVAGHAAQSSGLSSGLLKQMLPILAMLVAGHMAKRASGQQGGLGGILGSVLGGLGGGGGGLGGGGLGGGGLGGGGLGGGPMGGGLGGLGGILGSILGGRR